MIEIGDLSLEIEKCSPFAIYAFCGILVMVNDYGNNLPFAFAI
jgi:hypothetical protein